MVDRTENKNPIEPQGPGRHEPSLSLIHPPIDSSSYRSPSQRPSFGAAATSGVHSQSSDTSAADIVQNTSSQQPVRESSATTVQSPPTPHEDTLGPYPSPTPVSPSTSYFSSARDFTVSNMNIHNSFAPSQTLFQYLSPHIAHGAAHDSDERWNAPACHEETRVAIREDILSWIKHGEGDEDPKRMMWLSGPAGSGKTAIAGSVAETCKEGGLLAASFFFSSFSGSAERSSKRGLIATLAYHMSQIDTLHHFKAHLHVAVDRHPDIFRKNLKEQARCLILGPFRKVHDDQPQESRIGWPKVVIIDGLDEVIVAPHHDSTGQRIQRTSEDDQVEILNVLVTISRDPFFPFRIFVASRPESNITKFFDTDAQDTAVRLFLDSKYNPDADVERFLVSKFAHIRRHAGISSASWPGQPTLDRLVEMSSGQFIVPTTIIRWVEAGVPQLQLAEVMQLEQPKSETKNPFATLDALYLHILQRAHNPDDDPLLVVKWIVCITSAAFTSSTQKPPHAAFWRQFLEKVEGEFSYRLGPITSLVSVPRPNDISSPITIYHKSLTDFLSSPTRCRDLYVDKGGHNCFVADRIVSVLKYKGPAVPLASPADLVTFLQSFIWLQLLLLGLSDSSHDSLRFLAFLGEGSKAELASCDVAWWTATSLSALWTDSLHDAPIGGISSDKEPRTSFCPRLVEGIYWRIHETMGCDSNALKLSLTEHPTGPSPGSQCHQGCMKWRTGIRAKAKELGWCVHELEEVQPHEVHNLEWRTFARGFKAPGSHNCSICVPLLD
ncbi:hypothetical protein FA13DRAFT_1818112 [Coprinellus micaceus]|uniref:Nephrocystin 3-like N-terminal domain-containing protein n=1 Tax=Coprinellus micaceus TaxID=71717 RepID=A0A4Y7SQH7_COPMI|nr:hypothetical protein FA13DRAFT_1818112 [Coprinellus micaceus]